VRATKKSDDELGRLVESFNAMLSQIELGDLALREAHDRLEARVEERTRELQQEVAERCRSEQALNESHERLHIVTRATSDAVWDWNITVDSLCWNENY
jgi:nitrate/nitrite-specific signal transduction histidine kinase